MRDLKDVKTIYDHIVVPEELENKIRQAVCEAPVPQKPQRRPVRLWMKLSASAAALLLLAVIGLNTSEVFAREVASLPLIGTVARVLTVRSYQATHDITTTTVEVPEVQVESENPEVTNAITDINAEIQHLVNAYTSRAHQEIADYREAFLSTGGTEEEWQQRNIDVNVSYEVKYQSDKRLSLVLDAYESWVNFAQTRYFYNIDLVTGKSLTLEDFFGDDAYEYATREVHAQMKEAVENDLYDTVVYWGVNSSDFGDEFVGVNEDTHFYLNKDGDVVISYDKYEVAPGSMGIQEFVIPAR